MNYFFFVLMLLLGLPAFGQKKKMPPLPQLPDMNKLMKMSPAELEAYKEKMIKQTSQQAADYIDASGANVNKMLLPGYAPKPPAKDIKRLNLLPSQPPTRAHLVGSIQNSISQIQKGIPAPQVQEIKKFTASQPVEVVQPKAIADFYAGDPKGGMMMMMEMAAKQPDSLLLLNNLGTMLNLHGVEHKAVEIFQYCLQKEPRSAILLNNIGQSFLGLGDLLKATSYFNQCLAIDSLNIEANHSMGMLHYFKKEYDAAMKYFEREMSMAYRASTMAMAYKMGKKFNLRALMKRRNSRSGRPQKDYFEEITMGKFSLPDFPKKAREIYVNKKKYDQLAMIYMAETQAWDNRVNEANQRSIEQKGDRYHGQYFELVRAMLEELHEEFTPQYLSNLTNQDHKTLQQIMESGLSTVSAVKCPPITPDMSIAAGEALMIRCCRDKKAPLADKFVSDMATFLEPRFKVGQGRWKAYINQLIEIVQLDPSPANQMLVYNMVSDYFGYLSLGLSYFPAGNVNNLIEDCYEPLTKEELDEIIASDQKWKLECPPWLNLEVDFKGVVLKTDCNKYVLEVGGTGVQAGFEHEFKSGNSTILFGPAQKLELIGLSAELKSQLFITFDKNKEFADFGVKNTAEFGLSGTPLPIGPRIKLGGNLAGVEVSNTMALVGGYSESFEKKGAIAALFPN